MDGCRSMKKSLKLIKHSIFALLLGYASLVQADLPIKSGTNQFNLPYWPAGKHKNGAVIIVNGAKTPTWSPLLADLAEQLSKLGWSTVLINCQDGEGGDWAKEVPEVMSSLRQQDHSRLILIHYGNHLDTSLAYFAKPQSKRLNGLVMLSAFSQSKKPLYPRLAFPLLDIVAQFDYQPILTQYQQRKSGYAEDSIYQNLRIPGAAHDYHYQIQYLADYLHGWMLKLKKNEISPPPI